MIRSQSSYSRSTIITYLFFLLHLLLNTFASPTRPLCRQDQRYILLKLQKEFQIPMDNYGVASWNTSTDCCSWWGVTCDEKSGVVVSLDLMIEATNVTLNSGNSLFQLQHLSYLDLSHGLLHGQIPSSIANLSHLTHLDLSYNQLSGEVPLSLGNLNKLIEIDLSNNYLSGNIPNSFANFTKLSQLVLNGNRFTGGCIVLANLTTLFNINLSSNDFKSLFSVDLSGLHNLGQFVGSHNSFYGPFPSSLLMSSSLFNIEFSNNQFEGTIDFGNISSSTSKLTEFHVSYNHFDGPIPGSISTLRNLEYLDISHNNFQGHVPRCLSKLANLTVLDFSHNKLVGQVPDWLWTSSVLSYALLSHNYFSSFGESVEVADGTTLNVLSLASNAFQGPFPQRICKLKHLRVLDLSNNNFTGVIPRCLNSLEAIKLRNNSFSGLLPDIHGPELHVLDVSRNNLAGELPKSLINSSFLYILNVKGNKFNGTFPFWLSSLRLLMILMLGSNAFHGPVYHPSAYLGFPSLIIIDISNNRFSGSLPRDYFLSWSTMSHSLSDEHSISYMDDSYGGFVDSIELVYKGVVTDFSQIPTILKAVDFSGNRFWGHIPRSIGLLDGLILLNFSGNGFSGNIPPSLANLTILETLDLSRNNLSGEIPLGLGELSFLSNINFSYNHLEGSLPRSTQFQRQTCSSFVGNPKLHGLEEICGEIHVPIPKPPQAHQESLLEPEEPVLNWIAAAIAYGPGLFCGVVIGHIFTSYKYEWFMAR